MADWRDPRKITDDPRLEPLRPLVNELKNRWHDADFDGDYEAAAKFEQLYRLYNARLMAGEHFNPNF